MASKKKLLQAAAGSAGGAGLNVEEVFSTYLYKGTDANNITATTGIDMSGEGGMVWFKGRTAVEEGTIVDSARGVDYAHYTNQTSAHFSISGIGFSAPTFTSTGFTVGDMPVINRNTTDDYAAWSFRKAPKFFDVVTYTGDGVSNRAIPHSLGTTVGTIIVKVTSSASDWLVWHRSNSQNNGTASTDNCILNLNSTQANGSGAYLEDSEFPTVPTDTNFYVGTNTANINGVTYVAYLFAHNDGDGDFGDGTQDIIKCGSYTGNASNSAGPTIDLGFEPQWVMIKSVDSAYDWFIADTMRGWTATHPKDDNLLRANSSSAETANTEIGLVNSTGFQIMGGGAEINGSGQTYIYIAIRRGPMAVPTDATDVFDINTYSGDGSDPRVLTSNITPDLLISATRNNAGNTNFVFDRLRADYHLITSGTNAEDQRTDWQLDYNDAYQIGFPRNDTGENYVDWMWKRAPNYFDVVAYGATGETNPSVSHNLGVAPEMIWHKERDRAASWSVAHSYDFTKRLVLDSTSVEVSYQFVTNITDTSFNINFGGLGAENSNKIMYLFASLDGVSKVGSYTGDGTTDGSNVVDCGFSNGARFILVKSSNSATNWGVFDTARGITSGNDPRLRLNTTDAEFTTADFLVPTNSGFAFKAGFNTSGNTYIFYAIA